MPRTIRWGPFRKQQEKQPTVSSLLPTFLLRERCPLPLWRSEFQHGLACRLLETLRDQEGDEGIRSTETERHLQSNIVRIESWCEERSHSFSEFVICARL